MSKTNTGEPIDNFINRYISEPLCPVFKRFSHTPNMISVYGAIVSVVHLYYIWVEDFPRFTFYFWLSYIFDCLDGYYARKYNMVTKKGDYFEHIRDILSLLSISAILIFKYKDQISSFAIMLFASSSFMTGIHVGCTQIQYNGSLGESLDVLKFTCFHPSIASFSQYFGVGMYMAVINFLVLYISKSIWILIKHLLLILSTVVFAGYVCDFYNEKKHQKIGLFVDKESLHTEL